MASNGAPRPRHRADPPDVQRLAAVPDVQPLAAPAVQRLAPVRPTVPAPLVDRVEDPRVTVVVASRNRRTELLHSLARHRASVILLDNASDDGTADAVRDRHPHVDVVELPRNVGAYARTLGVARARAPYVAFADDDSWWAPGSLAAAARVLDEHPEVAVVGARILVGPAERLDPVCDVMAASPLAGPPGLPYPRLLGFVACAAMVRTETFLDAGGFDGIVRFPGEEERLAWDLAAKGRTIAYVDDLVVHHHPSPLRHSPDARVRALTRSSVLTALLRLPWRRAGRRGAEALGSGRATRSGLLAALPDVPRALRHRAVLPADVLADLDLLARPTTRPVHSTPREGEAA